MPAATLHACYFDINLNFFFSSRLRTHAHVRRSCQRRASEKSCSANDTARARCAHHRWGCLRNRINRCVCRPFANRCSTFINHIGLRRTSQIIRARWAHRPINPSLIDRPRHLTHINKSRRKSFFSPQPADSIAIESVDPSETGRGVREKKSQTDEGATFGAPAALKQRTRTNFFFLSKINQTFPQINRLKSVSRSLTTSVHRPPLLTLTNL